MKEKFYNLSDPELLNRSYQTYSLSAERRTFTKKSKSFKIAQDILQRHDHLISKLEPEEEAILCQTLAFNVRKRLLSEAGRKGALRLAEKKKSVVIQEQPATEINPSPLQVKRPFVDKIKNFWRGFKSSLIQGALALSFIITPQIALADTYQLPSESKVEYVDSTTLKRAAKVGEYLHLSDELAYQGVQKATKFLNKHIEDIDPSVKEAARLNNQFYLENLANNLTPEQTPHQFDEALLRDDVQEHLIKNAYEEVLLWETNGPPEYNHPIPKNLNAFLSYLGFRMKGMKKNLVTVMVSLATERGSYSLDIASDLLEIASVIGDIGNLDFEPSKIQDILAKYYENPIGGKPVLRNIALNCLTAV